MRSFYEPNIFFKGCPEFFFFFLWGHFSEVMFLKIEFFTNVPFYLSEREGGGGGGIYMLNLDNSFPK